MSYVKYLFYRLIIFLDTANESDTNYNIAWYMANNFKKVSRMGISELAKACMIRFFISVKGMKLLRN